MLEHLEKLKNRQFKVEEVLENLIETNELSYKVRDIKLNKLYIISQSELDLYGLNGNIQF